MAKQRKARQRKPKKPKAIDVGSAFKKFFGADLRTGSFKDMYH